MDLEQAATKIAGPLPEPEKAPRGTFSTGHLISPYFRIENSVGTTKLMVPYRSRRLAKLRLRLKAVRSQWGFVEQDSMTDRPGAGLPKAGPLPMPEWRPRPSLACPSQHNVSQDFTFPADQLHIPGFTWQFRTMLHRRTADKTPLFTCVGLEA